MPKKPRKAPAKAPVIHTPVEPIVGEGAVGEDAAGEDDEPLRLDLDQPPVTGVTGRPSVYSEWINSSPRPSVQSAWLNSPPAAPPAAAPQRVAPQPDAAASPRTAPQPAVAPATPPTPIRQAPDEARPPSRRSAAPADAAARPTSGTGRSRRATSARRLTAADRLNVEPETLEALAAEATRTSGRIPRPPLDAATEHLDEMPRTARTASPPPWATAAPAPTIPPTPAAPAEPDQPAGRAPGPPARATGARLPATLGETTKRVAMPAGGTGARRPSAQRPTPQPERSGHLDAPRAVRVRPAIDPAPGTGRAALEEEVALAIQETATQLPTMPEEAGLPAEASILIRGTARPPRTTTGRIVPRRIRPPSIVTQAVVALATVIVLMGALAISSPLGYGAAISGTFQAYANAVVWIPTPTPTATPTPVPRTYQSIPASPGTQAVVNEIKSIFGQYSQGALNVSHCESGWDPLARNPYPVGNSHAEGVFQVLYPSTWATTSYAGRSPYDYDANIRAAWEIFSRDGYSWREWECQPY